MRDYEMIRATYTPAGAASRRRSAAVKIRVYPGNTYDFECKRLHIAGGGFAAENAGAGDILADVLQRIEEAGRND